MRFWLAVGVTCGTTLVATPAAAQSGTAGSLSGCATDMDGGALPGVSVVVSAESVTRTVLTGEDGCYRLDLPAGAYQISAKLQGFIPAESSRAITPLNTSRLNLILPVGGFCDDSPQPTLNALWQSADAVVHVRTTGHTADTALASRYPPVLHTAKVLKVWKRIGGMTNDLAFLQLVRQSDGTPYPPESELVLFLRWDLTSGVYIRQQDDYCRPAAFTIEDGRIRSAGLDGYSGRSFDNLSVELNALAER